MNCTRVSLSINLPEGVKIKDSDGLYATVNVRGPSTGEFTFAGNEIQIEGLQEGLNASISDSVQVSISGAASSVSDLTKDNITVMVDVTGLYEGEHSVPVSVTAEGNATVETSPSTVKVVITSN